MIFTLSLFELLKGKMSNEIEKPACWNTTNINRSVNQLTDFCL